MLVVDKAQQKSRWRWQRVLSDLLIAAGVALLLYPVGTFGYAWWQQKDLARQLVLSHPALTLPSRTYFNEDMVQLKEEQSALRKAALETQRKAQLAALSDGARAFAASLTADSSSGGVPIGRIVIPKIGVDAVLIEGVGRGDLREGPGHWPETPLPGLGGNFVVSGHRTTYGAPFFKLDKLAPGDEIDVLLPYAAARYRVTRSVIVSPYQTEVVAQRGVEEISLATCHPIYSARQRLVVQAAMISFKLLDQVSSVPAGGG
jgi:LPXTG-site transpeptidase (sortase) family protein